MRKYIALFRLKFINGLQYRVAALAGVATQFFFGIVYIMVYLAFYESNDVSGAPMQLSQVVSYLWLNQIFFALVYVWQNESSLLSKIKNGDIAYELCRPINFYFKWYMTMYGNRLALVTLRFLPVAIVAFCLPTPYNLSLPYSIEALLLFIVSLVLSSILVTAISYLYHVITFFTLDEKGILSFLMVIAEIFFGGTVPIVFFPKFLQVIAYLLPFRYICDLPFRIYTGNILISAALPDLLGGVVWTIVIVLLGQLLTKKALKVAVVQGG